MSRVAGRASERVRCDAREAPEQCAPLNERFRGYSVTEALQYWGRLDDSALVLERRALRLDLAFPVLYGAAFLVALLTLQRRGSIPLPRWALIAAVGLTVGADWTENVIHLQALGRVAASAPPDSSALHLASAATRCKLYGFSLSAALTLVLWMGAMTGHAARPRR